MTLARLLRHETILAILTVIALIVLASLSDKFFTVENLLNDRIDVRDRTGATPNRFQAAYLDPIGRSIRLGVRKLF